uniref:uncharacterized protein LOC122589994 n=1 Tax=Erigeron canadensis TaxID=72917 RepID=UPI001CB972AF|nr:uncharacterized protein LOC122589994 [Erigeron canadensis]
MRNIASKFFKRIHLRELCGNSIRSKKEKGNFEAECQKLWASKPMVWKYPQTERDSDTALEHVYVDMQTQDGLTKSEMLLTGSHSNMFRCYEVGYAKWDGIKGEESVPDLLQSLEIETETTSLQSPGPIWSECVFSMDSSISNISIPKKYYPQATDVDSSVPHALMTTLGSETSGGSVWLINLRGPLDRFDAGSLGRGMDEIFSLKSRIWSADSYSDGSRAVVGTNIGAALIDIETKRRRRICRSESDVISLQLDRSEKLVLCGLKSGAIVMVDTRQKCDKEWFGVMGNVHVPSPVSCLVALKHDDYFLAGSMDGTIRLYDHRLTQRGAVQLYEGNVNSHTRIQMGVDPSERFLMSGGEDFYLRMWSINSGEMLYEDKFMNAVPSVLCWPRGDPECNRRPQNHFPGAWLGSGEGLFYVDTS